MRDDGTDKDVRNGKVIRTAVTWSGMAVLGVVACVVSQPRASGMMQAPPPDVVSLTGTIRDFKKNHVDFNRTGPAGHHAMNVALDLGADDRPTFRGTGFRVDTQWRDSVSNPIAPHLYGGGVGLVKLVGAPTISGGATVDTWDSSVGPYGGGNVGPAPTFYTGAEMTTIEVPADLTASANVGSMLYNGLGGAWPNPLIADIHCDDLVIRDAATLQIDGNIRILCETLFDMRDDASISFTPGSSLVLYTKGIVSFQDATVDSTDDPNVFTLYHLGTTDIRIADGAAVTATIVAPNAGLSIEDDSNFYGTYEGQTLNVANSGGFHLDESMPLDACGVVLNDARGTAGIASTGGIDSADSFGQWYRDVLGMNLSMPHTIDLVRDAGGIYEFISNEFYPIDGQLHGNQGDPHNNYFTFRFTAYFTYVACGAQFFEFMGSDDAWLFIDRSMAIDLGGIIPGTDQHVDLDRLGLVDGEVYAMQFFYAHRNPTQAIFRVRTNVPLIGTAAESVNASFD